MIRLVKYYLKSFWLPFAVAAGLIVLNLVALQLLFGTPLARILGAAAGISLLMIPITAVYKLATGDRVKGLVSLALFVLPIAGFLVHGAMRFHTMITHPRDWGAYEAQLPNDIGQIVLWKRQSHPFFAEYDLKMEVRLPGKPPRAFALPTFRLTGIVVFLGEETGTRYLHFKTDGDSIFVDCNEVVLLTEGLPEGKRIGTFTTGRRYPLRYIPNPDSPSLDGGLYWPCAVAVDSQGNLYVAETANDFLAKYNPDGQFVARWPLGDGWDYDLACDGQDNIYVVGKTRTKVKKFACDGTLLAESPRLDCYAFDSVTTDAAGNVYALENMVYGRVHKFNSALHLLRSWDCPGGERLWGVTSTNDGNVYVAQLDKRRICKFTSNGEPLGEWPARVDGLWRRGYPVDITAGPNETMYVAICYNSVVYLCQFTRDGELLSKWSCTNVPPGHRFYQVRIAVDPSGNIYVTDVENHRVLKFTSDGQSLPIHGSKQLR